MRNTLAGSNIGCKSFIVEAVGTYEVNIIHKLLNSPKHQNLVTPKLQLRMSFCLTNWPQRSEVGVEHLSRTKVAQQSVNKL